MTVIPVFVSSTFRDFHAERDELAGPVRDQLNDRIEAKGVRVEFIDLRWGVDTAALTEEERNERVLQVCIGEIDRCRPLFLGLIGDRPGWRPPPERLRSAAQAAGFAPRHLPRTVTALEMAYAAASLTEQEAVYIQRVISGESPPAWVDEDRSDIDGIIAALPTAALRTYQAPADGTRITDLREFSALVLAELTPRVLQVADDLASRRGGDYRAAEALRLDDLRRGFSDVTGFAQTVVEQVAAGASLCIFGPSGGGKSAAWLAAVDRLREQGVPVVSLSIGAVPETQDHDVVIRELITQLGSEPPAMPELTRRERTMLNVVEAAGLLERRDARTGEFLHEALTEAIGSSPGAVVAIDDLDRLNPSDGSRRLDLLAGLPARALVTTGDPAQMRILRARGFVVLEPPAIASHAAAEVSRNMAAAGGRTLPEPVVQAVAAHPRTPLWLELAVHELEALGERDFVAAENAGDQDPTALLVRTAEALPEGEEELIVRSIRRAVDRFGATSVRATLELSLASPFGLRRADLSAVSRDDELTIAATIRELDVVLTPGIGAARVAFRTLAAREAAATVYTDLGAAHAALASWLARKPDRDAVDDLALLHHRLFTGEDVRSSAEDLHRGSAGRDTALRLAARAIAEQRPERTALEALVTACREEPDNGSLVVSRRVVMMGADRTAAKAFAGDLLAVADELDPQERAELADVLDDPASRLEALAARRVDQGHARETVDAILTPLEREAVGTRYPAAPCEFADLLTLASQALATMGAPDDALFLASRALEAVDDFPAEPDHRYTIIQLRALRTLADHALNLGRAAEVALLLDRSVDLAGSALRSWPAHRTYRQGYVFRQRSRARVDVEDLCTGEADRLYELRVAQADALARKLELALIGARRSEVEALGAQLLDVLRDMVLSAAIPEREARSRAHRLSRVVDVADRAGELELAARVSTALVAELELVSAERVGGVLAGVLARHVDLARRGGADTAAGEAWTRLVRLIKRGELRGAEPADAARILRCVDGPPAGQDAPPDLPFVAADRLIATAHLDVGATIALLDLDEVEPAGAARAAMVLARAQLNASQTMVDLDALRETLLRCAGQVERVDAALAIQALGDASWIAWLGALAPDAGGDVLHQFARALSIQAESLQRQDQLEEAAGVLDSALAVARRAAQFLTAEQQAPYLSPGIAAVRALAQQRDDTERLARLDSGGPEPAKLPRPAGPGDRWADDEYTRVAQCLLTTDNTNGVNAVMEAGLDAGHAYLGQVLGGWRADRGDTDEALVAYARGAELGSAQSAYAQARLLGERGMPDEEKRAVERALELGHPSAPHTRARLAEDEGDALGAERFHRIGHERGDDRCSRALARSLRERGDIRGLLEVTRAASQRGTADGLFDYACAMEIAEFDSTEIDAALRSAIDHGSGQAAVRLGDRMAKAGRDEQAIELFHKALDLGVADRSARLGHLLREHGDQEIAEKCWRRGLELGASDNTACYLAAALRARGATDEAVDVLRRGRELGSDRAAKELEDLGVGA